jgi:CRISPR-associated endonuclease/helicase Cas3
MDTLKAPLPYEAGESEAAREQLSRLEDAGLASLEAAAVQIDEATRKRLFPYDSRFVPRDKDLFDLFDTTPDLTGADIDISRFIRDGDELDVQLFWQDIPAGKKLRKKLKPRREELCPVPFTAFRKFVACLNVSVRFGSRTWKRYCASPIVERRPAPNLDPVSLSHEETHAERTGQRDGRRRVAALP